MFGKPRRAVCSHGYLGMGCALEEWAELNQPGGHTQPVALSVGHSQFDVGTPTFSTSVCDPRVSFPAFEMTLTEGNKLEKKLFYSTFATVSTKCSA